MWADPYRGAAQGLWVRLTVWAAEGSRYQIGCITRLRFETTPCVTLMLRGRAWPLSRSST